MNRRARGGGNSNCRRRGILIVADHLDYLRARYYDTAAGRFVSRDSFDGSLIDPISENHFAYANGNPVGVTDPGGHGEFLDVLSAIGIGLNIATTSIDAVQLARAAVRRDVDKAQFYSVALSIDLVFMFVPFAGPFSGAGRSLAAIGGNGVALLSVATLKQIIQAQRAYGGIRALWGGARGLQLMAEVADLGGNSDPPIVPEKLSRDASDAYRKAARGLWQQITGIKAGWRGYDIHHRIPLEWAHIFPKADPNRIANLVAVKYEVHKQISAMWAEFAKSLGGRTPTQAEVMRQVLKIDDAFGSSMKFIDEVLR